MIAQPRGLHPQLGTEHRDGLGSPCGSTLHEQWLVSHRPRATHLGDRREDRQAELFHLLTPEDLRSHDTEGERQGDAEQQAGHREQEESQCPCRDRFRRSAERLAEQEVVRLRQTVPEHDALAEGDVLLVQAADGLVFRGGDLRGCVIRLFLIELVGQFVETSLQAGDARVHAGEHLIDPRLILLAPIVHVVGGIRRELV